jgi:hypothetical protein
MPRVRRIARRELARGSFLSADPQWRALQLYFLSISLCFAFIFLFLAHDKLVRLYGELLLFAELLFVGGVIAAIAFHVSVTRRHARLEPEDVELDLLAPDVQAQLASGALKPDDLVQERGTWTTLLESMQFSEAAEPPHRKAQARARVALAVMVVSGMLLLAALAVGFFRLPDLIDWLAH